MTITIIEIFILTLLLIPFVYVYGATSFELVREVRCRYHVYTCRYGNYLHTPGPLSYETVKGAEVTLHKYFPPIYLDSHGDSKIYGPRLTYSSDERISLEGDFNKYFQLFSPEGYRELTLSILTPDVMQVLIDTNRRYDVQIQGNKLFVISHRPLRKNSQRIKDIEKILKALLPEIDHKSNTWSKANEAEASKARLQYINEQSVKIGKRYLGLAQLTKIFFGLLAVILYGAGVQALRIGNNTAILYVALGILCFPGILWIIHQARKYS